MTMIPPGRLRLIRKLADLDQEIAADECRLAANRGDSRNADLFQATLRDQRLAAERIVILLRRTDGD